MNKKIVPVILAVIIVAAGVIGYFVYSSNAYTGYAAAFNKSGKINSTEYNTSVKATVDGKVMTATGNMKIRDITSNVNFVNVMNIEGMNVTQFTDGTYIYVDSGSDKTKFKIGEKPETNQRERGEDFNIDYYIQEFSMLLDASKIKDLKITEKFSQNIVQKITKKSVSGGTEYDVTLAPQLVNDIFDSVMDEELGVANAPKCELKSFTYTALANKDNYISSVTYKIDMDTTFPKELTQEAADSTKSIQLEVTLDYVNPGNTVDFSLPDTSGF